MESFEIAMGVIAMELEVGMLAFQELIMSLCLPSCCVLQQRYGAVAIFITGGKEHSGMQMWAIALLG